jgi:hypothetical protein
MTAPREDSVLTSIREIQHMEEERQRETARRAEAAVQERQARAEAARMEAERAATVRAEALESERREEQRRRDEAERAARESREARELAIRVQADAERSLRAQQRADEHALAMAKIEAERRRGVQGPKALALVFGAIALTGALGWFGVYVPHTRQHAAELSSLEYRAQVAQRERDRVRAEADALESRVRQAAQAPRPTPAPAAVATHVPTRNPPPTRRVPARTTQQAAPAAIDIDGPDPLGGNDPFAMDDGARRPTGRGPRR